MSFLRSLVRRYRTWRNRPRPAFDLLAHRNRAVARFGVYRDLIGTAGTVNSDRFRGYAPGTLKVADFHEDQDGLIRIAILRRAYGWNLVVDERDGVLVTPDFHGESDFGATFGPGWRKVKPGKD